MTETPRTRVVIAPDSLKGTIDARAAAAALAEGWRSVDVDADLVLLPMSDGGEGTLASFAAAHADAQRMPVTVDGPHGRPVAAEWLLVPGDGLGGDDSGDDSGDTGVVELASTSGIELLGDDLMPFDADTLGFGQAIVAALDHGVTRLVVGIGSSASTDGGVGMLRALGASFVDARGIEIGRGARGLAALAAVDRSGLRALPAGGVTVITDVSTPLLGDVGAAAVFGPQKGLDASGIASADAGLARLAALAGGSPDSPGAGAAGGTGYALLLWGARLAPGAAAIGELIGLRDAVEGAAIVVTGEGRFDAQSAAGKVPELVRSVAHAAGASTMLVAGHITADADTSGFAHVASLSEIAGSGQAAMAETARWLREAGALLATAAARAAD